MEQAMDAKKPDRRTIKTRKALCAGLAELLTTKELHRITVQEIADKADVNRVTFYKHYLDVYDLYEKLENEVITELGILVLEHETDSDYMKHIIDYIDENRVIFSMIFSPFSTGTLRDKILKMINGTYLMIYRERYTAAAQKVEFEFFCHYHSNGCIAILEKWVRGGYIQQKDLIVKGISELDKHFEACCEENFA